MYVDVKHQIRLRPQRYVTKDRDSVNSTIWLVVVKVVLSECN